MSKSKKKSLLATPGIRWALLIAGAFLLIAIFVMMSVTGGPDLGPLEQALRNAGYQLYNPPRANWGPGFVFAGNVTNGRITNVEEVCPSLYTDVGSQDGVAIAMPDYTAKDDFTFQLSMNFLKKLIGAELDLGRVERERAADIKWRNVREVSYTRADQWLA